MIRVKFKDDERDDEEFDISRKNVEVESDDGLTSVYDTSRGAKMFYGAWQTKDILTIEGL